MKQSYKNDIIYIPAYFTNRAIMFYLFTLIACFLVFRNRIISPIWMIFGFVEVFIFFYFSNIITRKWSALSESRFKRKLFWYAFLLRAIYVLFIYFFYMSMTGEPFEFDAADSINYHDKGMAMLEYGIITSSKAWLKEGFSDSGFNIFLSVIYSIFGDSVIIARLVMAFFSAWGCILIYQLARRNFGEATARIAGVLVMLVPNLIYYCGLHLKETMMVFLCIAFIERADYLLRMKHFQIWQVISVILLGFSLFFFRTVLGAVAIFALVSSFLLSPRKISNWKVLVMAGIWVVILGSLFYSGTISEEISGYWEARETQQEGSLEFRAQREGGNTLATYGSVVIFTPAMLFVPFPTLTEMGPNPNENLYLMNGGFYTKNVYIFFVLIAFVALIRQKSIRQYILILSFILGYLIVLANSGYALSERFHLPALPFLLVLAAFGITQVNRRNKKYYTPYLFFMLILIIAWNWFKLAGRGLI